MNIDKVNRNFRDKRIVLETECMEVLLNTTNKCNIKCITCLHKYKTFGEHAPKELIDKVSSYLKNVDKIYLHGFGEPLANPDFLYFLEKAKYNNEKIFTSVFTNGVFLKKYAKKLVENGLDEILISLDASNDNLYREIRTADFNNILDGIRELRKLSNTIKIHITMVLTQKNIHDVFNFIELARDLNVNGVGLMNMYLYEELPPDVKNLSLLKDENWIHVSENIIKQAKKICQEHNLTFTSPECFEGNAPVSKSNSFCTYPFGHLIQIDSYGGVLPCCGGYNGKPLGNVYDNSLEEIWNGKEYQELRRCIINNEVYSGCSNCQLYKPKVDEIIKNTVSDSLLTEPINYDLRTEISKIKWFHKINLGNGIITPGDDTSPAKLKKLGLPEYLRGKTVLDIGAWDGFFSFEAERRGAKRVLATDYFCWGGEGCGSKAGFELARKALNSRVEDMEIDVLDLSPEKVGQFDLVLFLGVLYHMKHPLLALEKVFSVTKDQLILETHVDMLFCRRPAMAFYPGTELNNDPTNWIGPNPFAVIGMLKTVGFRKVEIFSHFYSLPHRIGIAASQKIKNNRPFFQTIQQNRMVFHAWR